MRGRFAVSLTLVSTLAAQTGALRLRVVEGEAGVYAPGAKAGLTVEATDSLGRPVAGARITFTLPERGPGGAFSGGLGAETVTADAQGRGSVLIHYNAFAGSFYVRVTAESGPLRAGTLIEQTISEAARPPRPGVTLTRLPEPGWSPNRWLLIGLAAGGAVAAGIALTRRSRAQAAAAGTQVAGVRLGEPQITIGSP